MSRSQDYVEIMYFPSKGGCGIREHMHIKAIKIRADLGYR